jgi:hypothetical protein
LAGVAHGQFTEIWTNGDLFATEQMASQCYSASVERCVAVGITPDEPSWWEYITGKNRAKLLSVKENISNCILPYIPRTNVIERIGANSSVSVYFSGADEFLTYCGLPTNSLDETPYFKTQYAETTGGWHSVMVMLTNMTVAADVLPDLSFNSARSLILSGVYATNSSMPDAWAGASSGSVFNDGGRGYSCSQVQTYTNDSLYPLAHLVIIEAAHQVLSWKNSGLLIYNMDTSISFIGTGYIKCYEAQQHGGDGGYYDILFDPQLDSVTTNWAQKVTWTNAIGQSEGKEFTISSDTNSIPPNYMNPRGIKGWEWDDFGALDSSIMVFDFSISNGFKYK